MSEYQKGYDAQNEWLAGRDLPTAEHALDLRLASIDNAHPYNRGGNDATRAYIAWLSGRLAEEAQA